MPLAIPENFDPNNPTSVVTLCIGAKFLRCHSNTQITELFKRLICR